MQAQRLNFSKRLQFKYFCHDANDGPNSTLDSLIRKACISCYEDNRLTAADLARRKWVQQSLQYYFRKCCPVLRNSILVYSFGSSANGFGFRNSDLDIYVEGLSINTTRLLLYKHAGYSRVKKIPCRVPVIKFRHNQTGFVGDLSFQNSIALKNSEMLLRYSKVTEKCRHLVYALKYLTKSCKIADAQHNFLSSYAFTLMAIHYLQQLETPVLPVLQEIEAPSRTDRHNHTTDGYYSYFYNEDNNALAQVWSDFGKNRQSISELFVGFLRYYAHEFDYANTAIGIHKFKISKDSTKNNRLITILDPFENERNLCVTLSPGTDKIIRNMFCNGYQHFCKVPEKKFDSTRELLKYFFDPSVLLGKGSQHYRFRKYSWGRQ